MSNVTKALARNRSLVANAQSHALQLKAAGVGSLIAGGQLGGLGSLAAYGNQSAQQQKYNQFHGWVHAAVHALAAEGAGQPVHIGKLKGSNKRKPKTSKQASFERRMTKAVGAKAAEHELEVILDHPQLKLLETPNSVQGRWQFVYSFIANLCLTGWAYVVKDTNEDGEEELYALPTSWVVPDHSKGAFAEFRIVNPKNPTEGMQEKPLGRDQVCFAYLPNPSDPLGALSPAMAQQPAIKIDDKIQLSQLAFFDNGIFPSVIITMGKNPHPDAPGGPGGRPRLTAEQRRQVFAAIRKVSAGISNYGNPAIIDGLIESIEKLSMTQNEMGWEKSEATIKKRILSAFGVHPFILGEEMPGSYAQAYMVEDRFCKKVNTFLDLLSLMMTDFLNGDEEVDPEKFLVWWEKCKAVDPSMEKSLWEGARARGDVTENEFRAHMDLPPNEDGNEAHIDKTAATQVVAIASAVAAGKMAPEQGVAILEGMGLPSDLAQSIAGTGTLETALPPDPLALAAAAAPGAKPPAKKPTAGKAVDDLDKAISLLSIDPDLMADRIVALSVVG